MPRRTLLLIAAALTLTTACGEPDARSEPAPVETASEAHAPEPGPPGWLIAMANPSPAAASCVVRYPEDLPEQPIAFDGTIASVEREAYDPDAAGAPVIMTLRINEAFRGDLGERITIHTWDFNGPGAPQPDLIGVRLLAAMSSSQDLMACGFTRPYSEDDARAWREVFGGEAEPTPAS